MSVDNCKLRVSVTFPLFLFFSQLLTTPKTYNAIEIDDGIQ